MGSDSSESVFQDSQEKWNLHGQLNIEKEQGLHDW